MNLPRPKGVRRRLLLTVVVSTAGVLAVTTGVFDVILWRALSQNADHMAREHAAARASDVRLGADGLVQVAERPGIDGETCVFVDDRLLEGPRPDGALNAAAARAARNLGSIVDVSGRHARLASAPLVFGGHTRGAVVIGLSLVPYERTECRALLASALLSIAALVAVALVGRWMLGMALRPVDEMSAAAESWSAEGHAQRFAVGAPPDELSRLAVTLDRLLDRLAASLRREQLFSAEVSHELRTPLTAIRAEAQLALRKERQPTFYRSALITILDTTQRMSDTIDTLVLAAHEEATPSRGQASAALVLEESVRAFSHPARRQGLELRVEPPAPALRLGVEGEVAVRIVQPLLGNACRYARHTIRLTACDRAGRVELRVDDDGPGVSEPDLERIFEPGVHDAAKAEASPSSAAGLGLPPARRLAEAVGGEVRALACPTGGRFVVRLPEA